MKPIRVLKQSDKSSMSYIPNHRIPRETGAVPTDFNLPLIARRAGYDVVVESYKTPSGRYTRHWFENAFVEVFFNNPYDVFTLPDLHCGEGHAPLRVWPHYSTTKDYAVATGDHFDQPLSMTLCKISKAFNIPMYKYWKSSYKDADGNVRSRNRPMVYHKILMHLFRGEWLFESPADLNKLMTGKGTLEDILVMAKQHKPLVEAYKHLGIFDVV